MPEILIPDFPKIECPFVRKYYDVERQDWIKYGRALGLREPIAYIVTPEITPGYEWVFDHPDTFATEKLHGSNCAILMENGRLIHMQNRMNVIDPLSIMSGKTFLIEAVFGAIAKGYVERDGLQFGEALGPKLNCNIYGLPTHLWYPFSKAREHLRYKSYHKFPKEFWGWSEWFRTGLKSLFATKLYKNDQTKVCFAEGVVFYNETLGKEGKPLMAKLRRDMFVHFLGAELQIKNLDEEYIKNAKKEGFPLKGY
jgi:hypothetical protein